MQRDGDRCPGLTVAARVLLGPWWERPHAVSPRESGCHRLRDRLQPCPCTPCGLKPSPPVTPARAKPSRPPRHCVTVPPCHHITVSPQHHVTVSPRHHVTVSPRHGIAHPQGAFTARSITSPRQRARPHPLRTGGRRRPPTPPCPTLAPGPPESLHGAGGGGGGGLIFSTHIEARMRESRAVCISDPPASGRQGSGAAAPLPLREASLARVVSGLGAAPADGANNSVFFSFFSVSLFSGASPGEGEGPPGMGCCFVCIFFFLFKKV